MPQHSAEGPDRNLILRILDTVSGVRESMGQDVQHNVDRFLSYLSEPGESALSTGRKFRNSDFIESVLDQIEEEPIKTTLSLTDSGAIGRGLIEGDPLEFGSGAVGMALGPLASAGGIKAILKKLGGGMESPLSQMRKLTPEEEFTSAMNRNKRLAERTGGDVNVPAGGIGIEAHPGSEIMETITEKLKRR